jgi:uncharacterized Tic20 family protein
LIWSGKKKQSHKIDQHGRAVLNFQVTIVLLLFVAIFFLMIVIGGIMVLDETQTQVSDLTITVATLFSTLPFLILAIFSAFQGIINALRTLSDKPIRYRLSIPFVK